MTVEMEAGKYLVEVMDHGWFKSDRRERHPTIAIQFKTLFMYNDAGEPEPCLEVVRTFYQAFTEEDREVGLYNMKAVGFVHEDLAKFNPEEEGAPNLIGNKFEIVCAHDSYEGDVREKWMIEQKQRHMTRDDIAPLQAKFSAQIAEVMGRPAYQAPEQPAQQPTAPNGAAPPRKSRNGKASAKAKVEPSDAPRVDANPDDDIPF